MSRSTKTSHINSIDYKPEVLTGYIYRITDSEGKNILVLQMITIRDGYEEAGKESKDMPLHRAINWW